MTTVLLIPLRTLVGEVMTNNDIYTDVAVCPKCKNIEFKQMPEEFNGKNIFFYHDWYFCIHCGYHHKVKEEKGVA